MEQASLGCGDLIIGGCGSQTTWACSPLAIRSASFYGSSRFFLLHFHFQLLGVQPHLQRLALPQGATSLSTTFSLAGEAGCRRHHDSGEHWSGEGGIQIYAPQIVKPELVV